MQACRTSGDAHELTSDELKRLQSHLLKMYKELESLCVRHDLTVMLAYGSVLARFDMVASSLGMTILMCSCREKIMNC